MKRVGLEAEDREALGRILEVLAEREAKIAEALYPLFFERRPDVVALFGVYALAEREEMVRETFRSLLALAEGEDARFGSPGDDGGSRGRLAANLAALGRSHREYGVVPDMYPAFVTAFVDVAAFDLDANGRDVLARALDGITQAMRRAGDEAEAQRNG